MQKGREEKTESADPYSSSFDFLTVVLVVDAVRQLILLTEFFHALGHRIRDGRNVERKRRSLYRPAVESLHVLRLVC